MCHSTTKGAPPAEGEPPKAEEEVPAEEVQEQAPAEPPPPPEPEHTEDGKTQIISIYIKGGKNNSHFCS